MVETLMDYKTGSNNLLSMTIFGQLLDRAEVPTYSMQHAIELCGKCKGVNGGCAIYAKHFDGIRTFLDGFYVVIIRLDMAWAIRHAATGKSIRHSNYMRSGWADRITMRLMWRILKGLEKLDDLYHGLGAGNCPRCSKKRCTVNSGLPCTYPIERRYSIEATGVDCNALHNKLFGSDLTWWNREDDIPHYMWRYGGVFSNDNLDDALELVVNSDKYSIDVGIDAPTYPMLDGKYIPRE